MKQLKFFILVVIVMITGFKSSYSQTDTSSHIGIGLNISYNYLFIDGGPLDFLPLSPIIEVHFIPSPQVDLSVGAWYYYSSNSSSNNSYSSNSSSTNSIFVFNGAFKYILLTQYKNSPYVGLALDYASFPEMHGASGKITPEGFGISAIFGGRFRVSKYINMFLQAELGYSTVDSRKSTDILGSSYNTDKKSIFSLTGVSYGITFVF